MKHAVHDREGRFSSVRVAFSPAAFAVAMVAVAAVWWASSDEEMATSTADTPAASSCSISPFETFGVPPSLYQWFELQDPVFFSDGEATSALQAELEEVRPWLDEAAIEQVPNGMSRIVHRGAAAFSPTNTVQVFPETVAVGDDVVEAYELANERGPGSLVVAVTVVDGLGATGIADSFYRTGDLLWPLSRCPDNGVLGQSELADSGVLTKGAIPVQELLEAIAAPLPYAVR